MKKNTANFLSRWKQAFLLVLAIGGMIMTTTTSAGNGRGDYHTQYNGQSIDDLIISYMEVNNIPGLTLAIVQAPYITRVIGYGLADTQKQLLASTKTVFNIGQITNAYTAVAIMQLLEDGKLKLEDSIIHFLPKSDSTKKWEAITIKDLLSNTSGLPSYTGSNDFDYSKEYTPSDIIALVASKPLLFEAGTKASRSDTNAYFLGLIIEKVSGMSYQDYVTKNQIERVGLKETYFISNRKQIKNETENGTIPFKHSQFLHDRDLINPIEMANGYGEEKGNLKPVNEPSWTATFSSSGIIASAQDISTWDISLAGDILVKDPKNRAFLYNPVTLKNGQIVSGNAGWLFTGHKGMMEIKGNIPGYSSFLSRFTAPSELVCVTLLANKGDLADLDILGRKVAGAFDAKLAAPQGALWSETVQSPYSVQETIDRVAATVKANGGTVFARIDHSGEATKAGQKLPATQVLIIGNPAKGTVMMQNTPAMALDLPLRVMATTDSTGQVWLSFTDPVKLAKEYNVDPKQIVSYKPIAAAMHKLIQKVVSIDSE